MKIVLATLHVRPSSQAVPLAAACLAAALPPEDRRGVRLVDLFPEMGIEGMEEKVLAHAPDLVALPLYVWSRPALAALAGRLKAANPALFLVAGGPEASADPEGVLAEAPFDALVRGEGEESFRELVEGRGAGKDLSGIAGVSVRTGRGIESGPERPPAARPEEFPSPWLCAMTVPRPGEGVLWETSRGCAFGCDFCYDARGAKGVRHLPMARLEAELDLFVKAGVGTVWVLDSTFNFPPERGKELLKLIARKSPRIHFHLEAKAEFLDRETVHLLSRISCSLQMGLQSVHPHVLKNLHRKLDFELFTRRVNLLQSEGVTFGLDLIYGLPGDDYAGFRASLEAALNLAPNHVELFPLALLPGTPLHRRRGELGLQAMEAPPYRILSIPSCPPAELEKCRLLAASADLFYNVGRAVAFFHALLQATDLTPASFLDNFSEWALGAAGVSRERFLAPGQWRPEEVLRLQEEYVATRLKERGRVHLLSAALDLMRFHFHYAETLLGEETVPRKKASGRRESPWTTPWRIAPTVRLISFSYEVLDLQEMVEPDLESFAAMFRPVGSTAVFLRRGNQVLCESLEEDFRKLLRGSDGRTAPREIFGGTLPREQGEEIVEFALAEGFLVPVE